jgi:hypothetical protein
VTDQSNPAKRRGCFFYGCLSLAVLGLLAVMLVAGCYVFLKSMVNKYTSTTPVLLERMDYTPEEMEALQARLVEFKKALDQGQVSRELILTAGDLNALIAKQRELQNKLFVRIEDDAIKGEMSLPLQDIGPFRLKGRYLNGAAAFKIVLTNNTLDVRLEEIKVQGRPLPGILFSEFKKQNLAKDFQQNPKTAADMAKFDSIHFTNNQVVLRNKLAVP